MTHADFNRLVAKTLKGEILDLFRQKRETMSSFTVWSHFNGVEHPPSPAVVNAALYTLVDEGVLYTFRLPGRETFFDKGEAYFGLAETTEGGTK